MLPYAVRALTNAGFAIQRNYFDGTVARYRAMCGDMGTAFVMSHFVPFGSLTEEGNRYGAEVEVFPWGPDVIIRYIIVPYMSVFDTEDVFLISQGVFEHIIDNERCMEKGRLFTASLASMGLQLFYTP